MHRTAPLPPAHRRVRQNGTMRRPTHRAGLLAAALLLIGGVTACSKQEGPEKSVADFLAGWAKGQFPSSLQIIDSNGASLTGGEVAKQIKSLSGDLAAHAPSVTAGKATITKNVATVPLAVAWPIARFSAAAVCVRSSNAGMARTSPE